MSNKKQPMLGSAENFALGGAAAIIMKTATAPIERVKLMVQNENAMLKSGRLTNPYKGVVNCTIRTFRTEGEGVMCISVCPAFELIIGHSLCSKNPN